MFIGTVQPSEKREEMPYLHDEMFVTEVTVRCYWSFSSGCPTRGRSACYAMKCNEQIQGNDSIGLSGCRTLLVSTDVALLYYKWNTR